VRRLIAAALVVAAVAACSGGGDDTEAAKPEPESIGRAGSEVVADATSVAADAPVAAYRVRYRIEEQDGDRVRVSRADLDVRRPFQSRLVTRRGDTIVAERVGDFGYLGQRTAKETKVLVAEPGPAPDDIRGDLFDAGDGEVRRVAGRLCQVHHFGAPLFGGQVVPGDTTDTCIDGAGIVLEEVVYNGKRILSRWLAQRVDGPPGDDVAFDLGDVDPVPPEEGGGTLQEVEPTSQSLGTFFELTALPEGFTHRGRYAIVPPQAATTDDENTRSQVIAGVADVYVRGIDVFVIDQGGTLGQVPPFGVHPNSDSVDDLGAVGVLGESFRTPNGAEVRTLIPPGRYVRVFGTLRVDDLVAIARSLEPVQGTGLVYR
jgi:hypothetical protein